MTAVASGDQREHRFAEHRSYNRYEAPYVITSIQSQGYGKT